MVADWGHGFELVFDSLGFDFGVISFEGLRSDLDSSVDLGLWIEGLCG